MIFMNAFLVLFFLMISNPAYSQNLTKRGGNWYTKFRDYILPPTATQNKKLVSIPANQQILPPKYLPNDVLNVIIGKHVTNAVHSPDEILQLLKMNKDSAHGILTSGSPEVYKNIPNAIAQLSKDGNNLALLKMIYEYPNLVDWKSANQPSKYIMTQDEFAKLSADILDPHKTPGIISREPKTSEIQFYNFLGKNMKTIDDNLSDQNKGIIYSNYFKSLMANGLVKNVEILFRSKSMFIENNARLSGLSFARKNNLQSLFAEIDKTNPSIFDIDNMRMFDEDIKFLIGKDDGFYLNGILKTGRQLPMVDIFKTKNSIQDAISKKSFNSFAILSKYWKPNSRNHYMETLQNILKIQDSKFLEIFLHYHSNTLHFLTINNLFQRINFANNLEIKISNEFIKNHVSLGKVSTQNLEKIFTAMLKYTGDELDYSIIFNTRAAMARISSAKITKEVLLIESRDKLQQILKYPAIKDRLSPDTLTLLREKFSIEI